MPKICRFSENFDFVFNLFGLAGGRRRGSGYVREGSDIVPWMFGNSLGKDIPEHSPGTDVPDCAQHPRIVPAGIVVVSRFYTARRELNSRSR